MRLQNQSIYGMYRTLLTCILAAFVVLPLRAQNGEAPLGIVLPNLAVTHMQGEATTLHALAGPRGTVLIFWSNACSWVEQYEKRVQDIAQSAADVNLVLVNANDIVNFPQEAGAGKSYSVPYVRDAGAQVARTLGAVRTPHVFAFDANRKLVYAGGIDDAPAEPASVQQAWLADVVSRLSNDLGVTAQSTSAFGCRIKLP